MTPPNRTPGKTGDETLSFPTLHSLNPETNVATIVAQLKGERILCRVKIDDLRKKYRVFQGDPMQIVKDKRVDIENASRRLIEKRQFKSDGSVMISYNDL